MSTRRKNDAFYSQIYALLCEIRNGWLNLVLKIILTIIERPQRLCSIKPNEKIVIDSIAGFVTMDNKRV